MQSATATVSTDLLALIGDKTPTVRLKINGAKRTFSVVHLDRIVARFGDDAGFRVILGCERCNTTCVSSYGDGKPAFCGCCEPSGAVTAQHLWIARSAQLISSFQQQGILPVSLFAQPLLEERIRAFPEREFIRIIERNAELREAAMTVELIEEGAGALRLTASPVAA